MLFNAEFGFCSFRHGAVYDATETSGISANSLRFRCLVDNDRISISVPVDACDSSGPDPASILHVDNPHRTLSPSNGDKLTPHVEFMVSNHGDEQLLIQQITTSCGCAVISSPKRILSPGETTVLEVTGVRPTVGFPATVNVTIESNASNDPHRKLTITGFADVDAPFVLDATDRIILRETVDGQHIAEFWVRTVEAVNSSNWLSHASCNVTDITVTLENVATMPFRTGYIERLYSFRASFEGFRSPAPCDGFIGLEVDPKFKIPVFMRIRPTIEVTPAAVFGSNFGDVTKEFSFRLKTLDEQFLVNPTVRVLPAEELTIESINTVSSDPYILELKVRLGDQAAACESTLLGKIIIGGPDVPDEVFVPFVICQRSSILSSADNEVDSDNP